MTVTTLRLPALGTHTHTHAQCTCTHTQPSAARGKGTDLLLLLGTCLSSAGVKEQPGERAGGHSVTWGMAQAGVASLRPLPRTGDTGNVLLPQPTDRMELLNPTPGRGCGAGFGTGTLWGNAGRKYYFNGSNERNCVINNLDD